MSSLAGLSNVTTVGCSFCRETSCATEDGDIPSDDDAKILVKRIPLVGSSKGRHNGDKL